MNNYSTTYNRTEYITNSSQDPQLCYQMNTKTVNAIDLLSLNLPYKTSFTKEKYISSLFDSKDSTPTSIGSSTEYYSSPTAINNNLNSIYDSFSFQNELRKQYIQSKSNKTANKASSNYSQPPSVEKLLQEISSLNATISSLKNQLNNFTHEKSALESINKDLESKVAAYALSDKNASEATKHLIEENTQYKNIISRYRDMLTNHFNLFSLISDKIQKPGTKIKGNLDYYAMNPNDHLELLEGYKKWFNGVQIQLESVNRAKEKLKNSILNTSESNHNNNGNNYNSNNYNYPIERSEYPIDKSAELYSGFGVNYSDKDNFNITPVRQKIQKKNKFEINEISNLYNGENIYDKQVRLVNENSRNGIKPKEMSQFYVDNCLACNVGCNVSNNGYSPMNFSPYEFRKKRHAITPIAKREIDTSLYL